MECASSTSQPETEAGQHLVGRDLRAELELHPLDEQTAVAGQHSGAASLAHFDNRSRLAADVPRAIAEGRGPNLQALAVESRKGARVGMRDGSDEVVNPAR